MNKDELIQVIRNMISDLINDPMSHPEITANDISNLCEQYFIDKHVEILRNEKSLARHARENFAIDTAIQAIKDSGDSDG